MAQTQEQMRAVKAWECIEEVKGKGRSADKIEKEYRSLAVGCTAAFAMNGLAQTTAFWISKKDGAHGMITRHFGCWLKESLGWTTENILTDQTALKDTDSLKLATSEALAFGNWIKRFAAAELKKG
ncbi:MAG: type III-B CRISPR module-associated protein Cmr5 [bacterium]